MAIYHITEADFQAAVVEYAKLCKWKVYFTWNSKNSPAGFPDLFLLRGKRQVVAELKVGRRQVTAEQMAWLDAFEEIEGSEQYVWRPSSWPEIERILK